MGIARKGTRLLPWLAALCIAACGGTEAGAGATGVMQNELGGQDRGPSLEEHPRYGAEGGSCGNGVLNPGEGCDDGNAAAGDGCSPGCRLEACVDAADFLAGATTRGAFRDQSFDWSGRGNAIAGSCGGAEGVETVYRYTAEVAGRARFNLSLGGVVGTAIHLRRSCETAGSEVACAQRSTFVEADLEAGETVYVVVEAPPGTTSGAARLSLRFFPRVGVGEACNASNVCPADAFCRASLCVPSTPPTLASASAWRSGPDGANLVVLVDGADAERNANRVRLRFRDRRNQVVPVLDGNGDGIADQSELVVGLSARPRSSGLFTDPATGAFEGYAGVNGFFGRLLVEVRRIDVEVLDSANQVSGTITLPMPAAAVVRAEGEACDRTGLTDSCTTGFCTLDGGICGHPTAPVITQVLTYETAPGVRYVVFRGEDPDEDVFPWRLDHYDAAGNLVGTYTWSFVFSVGPPRNGAGTFFAHGPVRGAENLATPPVRTTLTAIDFRGNESAPVDLVVAERPTRLAGESCDPWDGFDECEAGTWCSGDLDTGAGTCTGTVLQQPTACEAWADHQLLCNPNIGSRAALVQACLASSRVQDPGCLACETEGTCSDLSIYCGFVCLY